MGRAMTHDEVYITSRVADEVISERQRQHVKWGQQDHPSYDPACLDAYKGWAHYYRKLADQMNRQGALTWQHILLKEVYEALVEGDPEKRRAELAQVAAVAVAEIECIDRRKREQQ